MISEGINRERGPETKNPKEESFENWKRRERHIFSDFNDFMSAVDILLQYYGEDTSNPDEVNEILFARNSALEGEILSKLENLKKLLKDKKRQREAQTAELWGSKKIEGIKVTDKEAQTMYRTLMLYYHPDVKGNESSEIALKIIDAYQGRNGPKDYAFLEREYYKIIDEVEAASKAAADIEEKSEETIISAAEPIEPKPEAEPKIESAEPLVVPEPEPQPIEQGPVAEPVIATKLEIASEAQIKQPEAEPELKPEIPIPETEPETELEIKPEIEKSEENPTLDLEDLRVRYSEVNKPIPGEMPFPPEKDILEEIHKLPDEIESETTDRYPGSPSEKSKQ
jgi:hypothetical protein